jgi:2-C-methyl-D-erythritol 4-phosphate cytidylyltransferase / 2-C-methyl-D-erythritol 2,4-cyclodiphosphate synthase
MIAAIIAAAGSGERFKAKIPKALIHLGDKTLLEHAVARIAPAVQQIIVTAPAGYEDQIRSLVGDDIVVVTGGATRSESVRLGLAAVDSAAGFILVHDAARSLASTGLAQSIIASLQSGEVAVIPGLAEVDTVNVIGSDGYVLSTPDRAMLRTIQTPQGFQAAILREAHQQSGEATDDATLVSKLGHKVKVIAGEEEAMKITTPADLAIAMTFLGTPSQFRTGVGVDAHAFSDDTNRQLWLAGINWPDEVGVDGHSDGDVAAHAICDALFAATSTGDLGSNFGTSRPEYAGASGSTLLAETLKIITSAGYSISNVTVQIIGNRPRIGVRRAEAIEALSRALGGAALSISATTTDGMGLTGEGKGIAAIATALVFK